MCGIAGVFSSANLHPEKQRQVAAALEMLRHRGPDNLNWKAFSNAVLGHTRLSVVDLSPASNQPFSDPDGYWWITWNGEIYNYQELREELAAVGHRFRTLSDTEVLLKAYIQWGDGCQHRLNGMWSLAIFNQREQTLFLSRDRFGIKPLYWARHGDELFFSSEIKPLFCFGVPRDPNWKHLCRYLNDGRVPENGPETVFQHVSSLPPGHSLLVSPGRERTIRKWWFLSPSTSLDMDTRFEERVQIFRDLFEESVRLRARNDVPTAVSLSGGLDSSSVYGAGCKLHRSGKLRWASDSSKTKELHACSVIYPGHRVNEQQWINSCLEKWRGRSSFLPVTPSESVLPAQIEKITRFQEAPVWSPTIVSLHALYRSISEAGIRVVLEGHGADEMLGGYPNLIKTALWEDAAAFRFGRAVADFQCLAGLHSVSGDRIPYSTLRGMGLAIRDVGSLLRQQFRDPAKGRLNPLWNLAGRTFFQPELVAHWEKTELGVEGEGHDFDASLRKAFSDTILPYFLSVFDRATMAYGLESCTPFLDHRLVEFVFSLPKRDKVGRLSKRILREAGREWLPEKVLKRRGKVPFTAPVAAWFNSRTIQRYLEDTFNSADARSSQLIRARSILDFIRAKKETGFSYQDVNALWPALNIHLWDRVVCRSLSAYAKR
jgi:asparagine synthase (glutamine-hydrolysing)